MESPDPKQPSVLYDQSQFTYGNTYEYPNPVENQYTLTEAEQLLLEQFGLAVIPEDKVPQTGFLHEVHFFERRNNFNLYFSNRPIGRIYRQNTVFQRLATIRPELAEKLMGYYADSYALEEKGLADPLKRSVLEDNIEEFFEAYKVMTELVDINDLEVLQQGDDGNMHPDTWFLCR